ncbi:MAG: helix-turn-helix domain-containing protein [Bifidobacteriaceae bacterium]|jgi:DNA-binding XRE family transcriptional regulator|nr:helix-turn-helix domain-containing protein [Bifidobacteriaceae bacterium]
MTKIVSVSVQRELRQLGVHVNQMRKVLGMTADLLARRAGVTRTTLRSIERGDGTARLDNVVSVLSVLGCARGVVDATDPMRTELGRLRLEQGLPKRVRIPKDAL